MTKMVIAPKQMSRYNGNVSRGFYPLKLRQKGLSLVEVMIIMVAVSVVIGASLVPIESLLTEDTYKREEQKIERFHEAILGYAIRHRTQERTVTYINYVNPSTTTTTTFTIPENRLYLPCPDVDGDGYEDRQGFDFAGAVLTVNVALQIETNSSGEFTNHLLQRGNCAMLRGVLPWRTLGVPSHDSWGNRYTFAVDDVYSNAVVGFDNRSEINEFDIRRPVTVGAITLRDGSTTSDAAENRVTRHVKRDDVAVVNDNAIIRSGGVINIIGRSRQPLLVCAGRHNGGNPAVCDPKDSLVNVTLVAGKVATVNINFFEGTAAFSAGDALEGVPYVIVSHGANGYGAVNHFSSLDAGNARCNHPVYSGSGSAGSEDSSDAGRVFELSNLPYVDGKLPGGDRYCESVRFGSPFEFLKPNIFVASHRIRGGDDDLFYDDIVAWRTNKKLKADLANAGAFPFDRENFPVIGDYQ